MADRTRTVIRTLTRRARRSRARRHIPFALYALITLAAMAYYTHLMLSV